MKKNYQRISNWIRVCTFTSFTLLLVLFQSHKASAQATVLTAGDIAFTGCNTVNGMNASSDISFVLLKAINAATTINFTDIGYNPLSTTGLVATGSDATFTWTAGSNLAKYTEVTIKVTYAGTDQGNSIQLVSHGTATVPVGNANGGTGTGFVISGAGDQVFAFTGTQASPNFIAGIHMNAEVANGTSVASNPTNWDNITSSSGNVTGWAYSANRSAIPPALTNGTNAIMVTSFNGTNYVEYDFQRYNCTGSNSSTSDANLRAAINNTANWDFTNTQNARYPLPSGCTFSAGSTLTASITSSTNVSCFGGNNGSATVTASGGSGTFTYSWSPAGGSAATASNLSAGTYTVTVTSGAQSTTANVTISQPAAVPTPTPGSNTPVCTGNTINLTTPTITGATYSWTGPASFTSNLQNPTRSNATTAMAGTYSVTATVGGCPGTAGTTTVVVNTTPSTPAPASNSPVCSGNNINLSTAAVAGATYSWTGPNGFTSSVQNPTISNATTAMNGTYNVTITVSGCTSAAGSVSMTVNSTPSTPAPISNTPVCSGNTINLSTAAVAGATYSWTGPGGFTSALQNPTRTNATTVMAGTYSVTVTANGCTSTAGSTAVVVNTTPSTPAPTSNSPVCSGNNINLSTAAVVGATYSWTGPNSFSSSVQNPSISNATTAMGGAYSVTVTTNGCTSAAGSTSVTVNSAPATPAPASNSPVCPGNTINLSTAAVAGATYSWTGPNGFTSALQNPTISNATPTMSGTYSVTVTTNGCTSAPGSTAVTVNPPISGILSGGGTACAGAQTQLTITIPVGSGTYFGQLSDGAFFVGAAPVINVNVMPSTTTTYTIAVLSNGTCSAAPGNLSGSATVTPIASGSWTGAVSNNWNTAGNWCGGIPTASTDVTISGAVSPQPQVLNGNTADVRNITLSNNATLTINSGGILNMAGNVSATAGSTFNTANGAVNFTGSGAQTVPAGFTIANMTVSGGSVKTLSSNITVGNNLTLTSGVLDIGAYHLTMSPGSTITGGSNSSYVRTTTAGGGLRQQVPGNGSVKDFPVGNTTYNPASLSNPGGTTDNYTVSVRNEVLTGGTTGSQINPATTYTINRTWDISEQNAGGSNATLTLQWSGGQENAAGFDYSHVYISHYTGGAYDIPYTRAALAPAATGYPGAGPYTVTRTGLTSFSPFVIGSAGGPSPLPVVLTALSATNTGNRNLVQWSAAEERNMAAYTVERSEDGHSFSGIKEIAAANKGQYAVYDEYPVEGINYYRLRMTEKDGSATYSKTVKASAGRSEVKLTATPNPVQDELSIRVDGAQTGRVQLHDASGRIVADSELINGMAVIRMGHLASGTYFVDFKNGQVHKTQKVTRQ